MPVRPRQHEPGAEGACSGGTCLTAGSSPPGPRTRRWSAKLISSPPRTSTPPADQEVTGYLREREITLTYDPAAGTLQAGTCEAAKTVIRKAS
jgi:hypothetical protein